MTISAAYSPAQASGNGATVAFPFTFKTFAETDLVVVLTSSAGVETTKTLTTHYTVSLNADQNNNPGGTVTMLTAPANGETLTIARELSALQETDIANGGGFYPEVLEDALDRLTMLSQQNADILARSLRSSVAGGSVGDLPTVADRASKYLAFDANGDPVATSSTGSGPVISTFAETFLDDTTAGAVRTTLGAAASGANTDITSLNAPALGAATATTQAASDNTTKVATTAMVQAAIDAATPTTTRTTFTASGNLTIPAGVTQVIVTGQAPGGGGGGSTDGGDGGDLTFGPNGGAVVLTLGGGKKGTAYSSGTPGVGGVGGGTGFNQGGAGENGQDKTDIGGGVNPSSYSNALGGRGGPGMFGNLGGGGRGSDGTGLSGAAAGGGGAGEFTFRQVLTVTPSTQYDVTIGSVGTAGTTSGAGTASSAGKGGFFVVEYTVLG